MRRQGSKDFQNRRVDHTHDPDGIVLEHKEHNTTDALHTALEKQNDIRMFRMAFPCALHVEVLGCGNGWLRHRYSLRAAARDGMHSLQNNNMNLETRQV